MNISDMMNFVNNYKISLWLIYKLHSSCPYWKEFYICCILQLCLDEQRGTRIYKNIRLYFYSWRSYLCGAEEQSQRFRIREGGVGSRKSHWTTDFSENSGTYIVYYSHVTSNNSSFSLFMVMLTFHLILSSAGWSCQQHPPIQQHLQDMVTFRLSPRSYQCICQQHPLCSTLAGHVNILHIPVFSNFWGSYHYYLTPCEFFTAVLADGLSLGSQWRQVSISLQDSSEYSNQPQQFYNLNTLDSFSELQPF